MWLPSRGEPVDDTNLKWENWFSIVIRQATDKKATTEKKVIYTVCEENVMTI